MLSVYVMETVIYKVRLNDSTDIRQLSIRQMHQLLFDDPELLLGQSVLI
jgi:hypothetical protein